MKKLIGLFCLALLFACGKKEKEPTPATPSEHLVTGFNFVDKFGNPTSQAGNPNVKTTTHINGNPIYVTTYPNPTQTQIAFQINSTDSTSQDQLKVQIVAAPMGEELKSYNYPTKNQSLIGGPPVWEKTVPLRYGSMFYTADLHTLPAGAYRIYLQTDKIKMWDNILKE